MNDRDFAAEAAGEIVRLDGARFVGKTSPDARRRAAMEAMERSTPHGTRVVSREEVARLRDELVRRLRASGFKVLVMTRLERLEGGAPC